MRQKNMEVSDLPNMFQIAIACEDNRDTCESLHELFQRQQIEIDRLKQVINAQQVLLDEIVKHIQNKE